MPDTTHGDGVAQRLAPVVSALLGEVELPVQVRAWDGSTVGPPDAPAIVVRSPRALRRVLWAPGELGLSRAYVAGEIDVEGDVFDALGRIGMVRRDHEPLRLGPARIGELAAVALRLGAVGPPLPPPPEEAHVQGARHSLRRDRTAVRHHYDVGNDFYRLVLGDTMAYSCAYWRTPGDSLDSAQEAKFALVARKLGLREGMRLLDVGCGWGGMVLHAAREHGVRAVGITLSEEQAALARERAAAAGVADRVEIRVQDYREVADGPYDAISSIGMAEHVGSARFDEYAADLFRLLRPGGRLLNHAIARVRQPEGDGRSTFITRYVFPDGELLPLARTVAGLEGAGFEVRDVETLREHYARTLRAWVERLEKSWDEAVALAGEGRARVWRLYMVGSALAFDRADIGVDQVLAVRAGDDGASGMPASRLGWP